MLDIKFLRENPDVVRENMKKKFQDNKLPLVDQALELDARNRAIKMEVENLRAEKNRASKQIGALMAQKRREEADELKMEIAGKGARIDALTAEEKQVEEDLKKKTRAVAGKNTVNGLILSHIKLLLIVIKQWIILNMV